MGREKCDKCGCNVFHENESDKLKCANKTDGSMEEAQQAFEEWFYNYNGINKHEGDAIEVGWLAGVQWEQNRVKPSYVTPLEKIITLLHGEIEKLQAQLTEAEKVIGRTGGTLSCCCMALRVNGIDKKQRKCIGCEARAYLEKYKGEKWTGI